jgi:hypothetical protein
MAEEKRWMGDRNPCDICGKDISNQPFVDGKTKQGPWALMCLACYRTYGVGLGQGKGQQYNAAGIKVGG